MGPAIRTRPRLARPKTALDDTGTTYAALFGGWPCAASRRSSVRRSCGSSPAIGRPSGRPSSAGRWLAMVCLTPLYFGVGFFGCRRAHQRSDGGPLCDAGTVVWVPAGARDSCARRDRRTAHDPGIDDGHWLGCLGIAYLFISNEIGQSARCSSALYARASRRMGRRLWRHWLDRRAGQAHAWAHPRITIAHSSCLGSQVAREAPSWPAAVRGPSADLQVTADDMDPGFMRCALTKSFRRGWRTNWRCLRQTTSLSAIQPRRSSTSRTWTGVFPV